MPFERTEYSKKILSALAVRRHGKKQRRFFFYAQFEKTPTSDADEFRIWIISNVFSRLISQFYIYIILYSIFYIAAIKRVLCAGACLLLTIFFFFYTCVPIIIINLTRTHVYRNRFVRDGYFVGSNDNAVWAVNS